MIKMKDSGIEWVHNIPSHWEVIKGKYIFTNRKDIVGARVDDYERLALTLNGVIKRSKDDNEGLQPERFDTYQILRKDELVFKLIDLKNISTSRVGLSPYEGIVSSAYIVLTAGEKIYPSYAEKYYLMMWMHQVFNALGDSGVRSSLNVGDLLNILVPLPPFQEQIKIAEFLDKKVEEIDYTIELLKKQITELKILKSSLIYEKVTKGIDTKIPMKDSGIEWVHNIPSHWEVIKGKYIFTNRKDIVGARVDDYERLALTLNGVIKRSKDDNEGLQPERFDTYQILRKDELVFKLIDLKNISTSRVGLSPYEGIVSSAYIVLTAGEKIYPSYAEKYYLMMWMHQVFNALGDSGVRSSLNVGDLLNILVPLPPFQEQIKIAEFLDKKVEEIDALINDKFLQVENLQSYKSNIIYEYITGKKEVES
ncbi:MAG: restriction endonuclease subunit S [Acholeplasmatales bacterium]